MAQASRRIRKIRRWKRERSLALKMMELALGQRDQARFIAAGLEKELQRRDKEHEVRPDPELPPAVAAV